MIGIAPTNTIRMKGERLTALDLARSRAVIMLTAFVLAYGIIAVRVVELGFVRPYMQAQQVATPYIAADEAAPMAVRRGAILDRNGEIIATSLKVPSLYIDPYFVQDGDALLADLRRVLPDLNAEELRNKIEGKGRFYWLKRALSPDEQAAILDLGYPALGFKDEYRRVYPQGALAAHMTGFAGLDNRGIEGLERTMNAALSAGDDVRLTIDVRVQHALREALGKYMTLFSGIAANGIVMNAKTGDVVAAVTLPDYDPNQFQYEKPEHRYNRLTQAVYEMGSTFKTFSTAAALDHGDAGFDASYDATKAIRRGNYSIGDYHGEERELSLPEVFMHSSNIGTALMAEELGTPALKAYYKDLGLFDRMRNKEYTSASPLLPATWRDINTVTASYGHGISVTPMHLVRAFGSIVNGGVRVEPHILASAEEEGQAYTTQTRIISEDTSRKMRQLLRLTVLEGTGKNAEVKGFGVGGKTGTAEKIVNGRYDQKKLVSSFIGAFPMNDPEYVVLAMVDEPKPHEKSFGYATGGWAAAPVVAETIQKMTMIYGMAPSYTSADDVAMITPLRPYIQEKED